MKGKQDHIRRIFDTKNIDYKEIDIAAPNCVDDKKFMQEVVRRANPDILAIPPQLFQDDAYRGVSVMSVSSCIKVRSHRMRCVALRCRAGVRCRTSTRGTASSMDTSTYGAAR